MTAPRSLPTPRDPEPGQELGDLVYALAGGFFGAVATLGTLLWGWWALFVALLAVGVLAVATLPIFNDPP